MLGDVSREERQCFLLLYLSIIIPQCTVDMIETIVIWTYKMYAVWKKKVDDTDEFNLLLSLICLYEMKIIEIQNYNLQRELTKLKELLLK